MNTKKLSEYIREVHKCAERYSEAEYQREHGDINKAIELHKSNILSFVDYSASYISLSEIYRELGDFDNEVLILKKGIDECDDCVHIAMMNFRLKKLIK